MMLSTTNYSKIAMKKFIIFSCILFLISCTHTSVRKYDTDISKFIRGKTISILPMNIEIVKGKIFPDEDDKGEEIKQRLTDKEVAGKELLHNKLEYYLAQKGLVISNNKIEDESPEIRSFKKEIKKLDAKLYKKMRVRKSLAKTSESRLDKNNITKLYNINNSDLLLYIQVNSVESSSPLAAMKLLGNFMSNLLTIATFGAYIYADPVDYGVVKAFIIEGETGNVIWSNFYGSSLKIYRSDDANEIIRQLIARKLR